MNVLQEMTEGLAEEFAVVSEQMGHGASKPRVSPLQAFSQGMHACWQAC